MTRQASGWPALPTANHGDPEHTNASESQLAPVIFSPNKKWTIIKTNIGAVY